MCSSKKSCVCEEKGPLKKRIERMSAHTERWLKGGNKWGAGTDSTVLKTLGHTPHSIPFSPYHSSSLYRELGRILVPCPKGSTQVKHLSLAHCNNP